MGYKLKLEVFEGPLDLLLYLIKKNDIEIADIPIVEITEQYLEYIDMMKLLDLDVVGDFLVMAATLMQIKSRMLLPPEPGEEEELEDDPRNELIRRLQEYKRFKDVADTLKEKETRRKDYFSREINEEFKKQLVNDAKETYFEANLFDLITALSEALNKTPEETLHEIVTEEFTVEQKIHDLLHACIENKELSLKGLFVAAKSKMEMIVTFMAILELIRLKEIKAVQKRIFDDITLVRNSENIQPSDASTKETQLDVGEQSQERTQEADGEPSTDTQQSEEHNG